MSAKSAKSKKNPVTVRGDWLPVPLDFLRSRACAELPPVALKMLVDLCSQLGRNAQGNGDLCAAPMKMAPRGWTSNATRVAALQLLLDAGLIVITARGDRRRPTLYAVTFWPLQCDFSKLDHGPGSYSTLDWEQDPTRVAQPTLDKPATWQTLRKNEKSPPATGQPPSVMNPPRDNLHQSEEAYEPATGT